MNTLHKGHIAELKATLRALEKGYTVSKPVIEARYDIVVDTGDRLLRVQVKYADSSPSRYDSAVNVRLRHWKNGTEDYQTRTYQPGDVDLLLVYIPRIDKVVALEPSQFCNKPAVVIRLEPPKNGQKSGVKMAQDLLW